MEYQNIITAVWGLLGIIFTSFSGIAINQGVRFIKSKHAEHLAIQVVLFVEDMFGALVGPEKRQKAIHFLGEKLRRIPGFKKITDDEIDSLIRAAYQKVKMDFEQDMSKPSTMNITTHVNGNDAKSVAEIINKKIADVIVNAGSPTGSAKIQEARTQGAKINDVGTTSSKIVTEDDKPITQGIENNQNAVSETKNAESPEAVKETAKSVSVKTEIQEVEKPLSELTLTDLKNVMTQVVKDQLQSQKAAPVSSSVQTVSAQ